MTKEVCPICDAGHLHDSNEKNTVEYKGRSGEIDMAFSVCDECGSEQASTKQLRANKRAMIAYRKKIDGLLSGDEIVAIRARLGITQSEAAKKFGGGPVAFSKYETNDVAQSGSMDKLLRIADAIPEARAGLDVLETGDIDSSSSENMSSERWTTLDRALTNTLKGRSSVRRTINLNSEVNWKLYG